MKLRARWRGPLPSVGDYLRSEKRPRFAYRIVGGGPLESDHFTIGVDLSLAGAPAVGMLHLEVERVRAGDVPDGARVHSWRWDPRGPKRRS